MILIDANVWIDHFRSADAHLGELIRTRRLRMHAYTIGELALGNLPKRESIIAKLERLPAARVVSHADVMDLIAAFGLAGTGVGYVDCHILASAQAMGGQLWTRDRRLAVHARKLSILYEEPASA